MKRSYESGMRDVTPDFFIGNEVENTKAKGMKTLFCSGKLSIGEILKKLDDLELSGVIIDHIYLNSNHTVCFDPQTKVKQLCSMDYWVTVEYDFKDYELNDLPVDPKFIPMLSIKLPYIETQKNFAIKIDDIGFDETNSGVWTVNINEIPKHCFTSWDAYLSDKVLE